MARSEHEKAVRVVERWRTNPEARGAAAVGSALLKGTWLTRDDLPAKPYEASESVLSQCVKRLKVAGFTIEEKPAGANGLRAYRVAPGAKGNGKPVARERSGITHPELFANLTVTALVAGSGGELMVSLSDGNGNAWTAELVGHVER